MTVAHGGVDPGAVSMTQYFIILARVRGSMCAAQCCRKVRASSELQPVSDLGVHLGGLTSAVWASSEL